VSLCAHRTHESRPPKPRPAAILARVDKRSSFWGAQLYVTARLYERLLSVGASFRSTNYWWCALLYHYFQKDVHGTTLLPFFLHQIRSTSSSCSTCRLLETAPPVPPTLVLPLGITWSSHLLVVFFLFLYRLNMNTSNPYDIIMLLIFTRNMIYFMIFEIKICHFIIFEIKIYRKIAKTLTSVSPPLLFG
jgi:hypothetical protein